MRHIYLAGPCKYEEDGGKNWRCKVSLHSIQNSWDIKVWDPTAYFDYECNSEFQKTDRQIREFYFQAIKKAEAVLVNLNGTDRSIGTAMEVQYAVDHDVPVIGFGDVDVYPWVRDSCTVVFDTLDKALLYIGIYYD